MNQKMQEKDPNTYTCDDFDVAIIGMACNFPQAANIDQFWENIKNGKESITDFSEEELLESYESKENLTNPSYIKRGAVVENVDKFDADFFSFTPYEARITDPQHRVFLETAWNALESAGYAFKNQQNSIGVFGSTSIGSYLLSNIVKNKAVMSDGIGYPILIGNDKDFLCSRVSYKLNLRGPSLTVQTACSGSLVAVHYAWQSLINGECDVALAGGVSIMIPQQRGYVYKKEGILSQDGVCRAFDAAATGTVKGNGCGLVVLKPLQDALRDHDTIYAVIKSSATNNDGSNKIGFTAPSVQGQSEVIREALSLAKIDPEAVSYVETHGTGTALGDPIEIRALTRAYRELGAVNNSYCAIGSLKPNIGHLDAASGVAGLIKATLCLYHNSLPPSINYSVPNKEIDFAGSPFYVNSSLQTRNEANKLRYAGVSSFGLGGTNSHVILGAAPQVSTVVQDLPVNLFVFSGKDAEAPDRTCRDLAAYLKERQDLSLTNISYTLCVSREVFPFRSFCVAGSIDGFTEKKLTGLKSTGEGTGQETCTLVFSSQQVVDISFCSAFYYSLPAFKQVIDGILSETERELKIELQPFLFRISRSAQVNKIIGVVKKLAFIRFLEEIGVKFEAIYSRCGLDDYLVTVLTGQITFTEFLDKVLDNDNPLGFEYSRNEHFYIWPDRDGISLEKQDSTVLINSLGKENTSREQLYASLQAESKRGSLILEVGGDLLSSALVKNSYSCVVADAACPEKEMAAVLDFIGKCWIHGKPIEWNRYFSALPYKRIPLPTYPFVKKTFWIDPDREETASVAACSDSLSIPGNLIARIISIWEQYLGYEGIKEDDDYFELGGDSLAAVQITAKMEEICNLSVTIHDLMELGTPAAIAATCIRKLPAQTLMNLFDRQIVTPVQKGSYPVPLFCVHPAGGTVFCYHELARYLDKELTLYGIQFPDYLLNDKIYYSVKELAAKYVRELRKIRPKGPYWIGGYSFGGNVAYEMALQLEEAGEEVWDLTFFDTHPPDAYNTSVPSDEIFVEVFPLIIGMYFAGEQAAEEIYRLLPQLAGADLESVILALRENGLLPAHLKSSDVKKFFNIWKYNHLSLKNYHPQRKFSGGIMMFRAAEQESGLVLEQLKIKVCSKDLWRNYINRQLELNDVPGDHYSMFGDKENLIQLARTFNQVFADLKAYV